MDDALTLKVVGLFVMLVVTLLFGLLPFHSKLREGRATAFAEAFSGGVFLAASLLDLIPDSFEDFGEYNEIHEVEEPFPFPTLMVIIGFVFALVSTLLARNIVNDQQKLICSFAPLFITINDPNLRGLATTRQSNKRTTSSLITSKKAKSDAVGEPIVEGYSLRTAVVLIVIFAMSAPTGIAVGIGINTDNPLAVSLLNGLASGTFLYVAVQVIFGLFGDGGGHSHDVAIAESKTKAFLLFFVLTFHSIIEVKVESQFDLVPEVTLHKSPNTPLLAAFAVISTVEMPKLAEPIDARLVAFSRCSLAVGVQRTFADTAVIFIAIMLHKGVAAFAVGINIVLSTEMSRRRKAQENLAILGDQGLSDKSAGPDQIEMDNVSETGLSAESPHPPSASAGGNPAQEYMPQNSSIESEPSVHAGHMKHVAPLSQIEALCSLCAGITLFAVIRIFVD